MRQRGFSLLEILVAFSILALSLGVLMQIFSGATRNADLGRDQALATALAQSILAGVGVESPLAEAEAAGSHDERFRWRLRVVPYQDEADAARQPASPLPLELWQIDVRVAWSDGARERVVSLSTLRSAPRTAS